MDLAHVDRPGFWDAVEVHDRTQPLIVTHTGVCGVTPHWRNLDDEQIRAVADTGGVVGVLFAGQYLRRRGGPRDGVMVLEHLEHIAKVAGDEAMALGSDFDGFITPPKDIRDGFAAYYRLVQGMLERGWSEERIRRMPRRELPAELRRDSARVSGHSSLGLGLSSGRGGRTSSSHSRSDAPNARKFRRATARLTAFAPPPPTGSSNCTGSSSQ